MAKQLYPNIVRGGMAIPLGNNYYFMKGRKHTQGGIDVGKDLEVEGGEIMKLDKNNVKVFSAVPFLNGRSPVEKILGGENPNKVFAQQERFKKVNKINDDGTKAKYGKRKINTQNIPESEQYAVTTPNGQRKVFNNKEKVQQYITVNTPKGYSLYDTTNYGSNIDKGQTAILNRNTEREIEKATEEEIRTNARKANIKSNKEYAMEALNAMPIIGDGMDIYSIVKDAYNKNYGNAALTAGMMLFPFDKLLKPVGKGIKKLYTNVTDRLNTNTNLIDLNTNLFNNNRSNIINNEELGNSIDIDPVILDRFNYEESIDATRPTNNTIDVYNNFLNNLDASYDINRNYIHRQSYLEEAEDFADSFFEHNISNNNESLRRGNRNQDSFINNDNKELSNSLIDENNSIDSNLLNELDDESRNLYIRFRNDEDLWVSDYRKIKNNPKIRKLIEADDDFKYFITVDDYITAKQRKPINGVKNDEFILEADGIKYTADGKYMLTSNGNTFRTDYAINLPKKPYHYVDDYKESKPFDKPYFTKYNYPGKDRTSLIKGYRYGMGDVTDMYHGNIDAQDYISKVNKEFNEVPHGGAIGFDHDGALSKSSSPMFVLQLLDKYRKGYIGKIFNPINANENYMQKLNYMGREYYRDSKGRIRAITGDITNKDVTPISNQEWVDWFNETKIKPLIEETGVQFPLAKLTPFGAIMIPNMAAVKLKYGGEMNRQKAPFGILKNLGEIFGFSKKDDKPKETSKPKKTNKPISKIHIGGTPNEARQKYYDLDTEFADSVKVVSKRYGLNPNLVASRLAKEGPVDHNIKLSNDGYRFIRDVVFGPQWGLDDLGNHIKEGKVNIKESWNNIDVDDSFVNEKGRLTNTVYSPNWVDGIYGTAAELKYRRDYMKKHFPKMTEEQLDAAAAASFNRGNAGARKWINRGGNYMQYKPFIKLKQLGGKANIYRLDSNGKSGLRMNISTGDETKARKKALLGTEDPYLSINDSYRHFVDRSKFMEEWIKRNNPIGDKPDVNKLAKEIITKPSNITFIEAPKDIKINYSQGLKDYVKNATNVKPSINWNKIGTAIKPYAGSIIDTVGNIATSLINASTLNKMRYSKQPIPQIANKLKTSVNINPQLKTLNESYNQYTDYINNNTASSKVAREALQRARIKNVLDTNTLYATKENLETELINKDRINQQTVANTNVDNYNKWLAGKAEFDNTILDKKSENIVGAINNITSSFNTSINNIKKDRQFNNNLISVLAANPNVNPEYLRALGADWVTDKMIEDWKLANKKK